MTSLSPDADAAHQRLRPKHFFRNIADATLNQ
jgi:hypothetical protein